MLQVLMNTIVNITSNNNNNSDDDNNNDNNNNNNNLNMNTNTGKRRRRKRDIGSSTNGRMNRNKNTKAEWFEGDSLEGLKFVFIWNSLPSCLSVCSSLFLSVLFSVHSFNCMTIICPSVYLSIHPCFCLSLEFFCNGIRWPLVLNNHLCAMDTTLRILIT